MSNYQQKNNAVNTVVNVNQLSILDQEKVLLKDVDLTVTKGAFHCIIGESGSGKSLLTRTILGMKQSQLCYQGDIDIDLTQTDAVFQDVKSNMFQNITLAKHFQYIYEANRTHLTKQRIKEDVLQMMQLLGLRQGEQLLERYPFELSGGMAQRVAFIMSLIRRPNYLFLDEPTSALDQENIKKFMHYLLRAQERYQMTIVFITHDINLVKDCATHISIMQQGKLIENGEAASILTKPTHNYTKKLITIAHRRQPYA